jgi:hypothetical protein
VTRGLIAAVLILVGVALLVGSAPVHEPMPRDEALTAALLAWILGVLVLRRVE